MQVPPLQVWPEPQQAPPQGGTPKHEIPQVPLLQVATPDPGPAGGEQGVHFVPQLTGERLDVHEPLHRCSSALVQVQLLHLQLLLQVLVAPLPQLVGALPAAHSPWFWHAPQSDQVPLEVQVRDCVPQFPQACVGRTLKALQSPQRPAPSQTRPPPQLAVKPFGIVVLHLPLSQRAE
jgi:hypothetical protein